MYLNFYYIMYLKKKQHHRNQYLVRFISMVRHRREFAKNRIMQILMPLTVPYLLFISFKSNRRFCCFSRSITSTNCCIHSRVSRISTNSCTLCTQNRISIMAGIICCYKSST
jgi:hypothetical protein